MGNNNEVEILISKVLNYITDKGVEKTLRQLIFGYCNIQDYRNVKEMIFEHMPELKK